jgi:hypothetical protein
MPCGKCGEARAGMSRRSGGVESRNSSDRSADPRAIPAHRRRSLPPQSTHCGTEGDPRAATAGARLRDPTADAYLRAAHQGQMAPPPRVKLMSSELADIPDEFRTMTQAELEIVAGVPGQTPEQARRIGNAKAELVRRDREYAEGQERDRREWETRHQAARQEFEEELAKRQMDHAAALAKEQLDTAQAAARAARMAAWAAVAAALGAVGQGGRRDCEIKL